MASVRLGDPTTSADWLDLWQRHFGSADDLCLSFGDADLRLTPEHRKGARVLRSYTNGHAQRALPDAPSPEAASRLLGGAGDIQGWDVLHLQGMHPDWAHALCSEALRHGMLAQKEHRFELFLAEIGDDPEAYLRGRSKSTFKRKASSERALERLVSLSFSREDPVSTLGAYMDAERKSWKADGGELLTASHELAAFYQGVAALREAHMYCLRADGEIIAGYLGLESESHVICLKTFYAAEYAKYSIGFVLMRRVIDDLIARGFRGRIDLYTSKSGFKPFATDAQAFEDVLVWNTGARAATLRLARAAIQKLRG